jgi:hypothetical protein
MDYIKLKKENTEINTLDDWGLVPLYGIQPPVFEDGVSNGFVDFVFSNSSDVVKEIVSSIKEFLKDANITAIFSRDDSHVYSGSLSIECNINPYSVTKLRLLYSFLESNMQKVMEEDKWEWDEFDFDNDEIDKEEVTQSDV